MADETNTNQSGGTQVLPIKIDVKIKTITPKNNLLAFANVTFNDSFAVNGLKVCTGQHGLFVSMPSVQNKNGEYIDMCCPITSDFRNQIHKAVVDGYRAVAGITQDKDKSSLLDNLNAKSERIKNSAPPETSKNSSKKVENEH